MAITVRLLPSDARDVDYGTFEQLLLLASLPVPDLMESGRFFAIEDDRGLVGFGGLEGEVPDQMIRSVAVAPGLRHRGFGHAIVPRLIEQARTEGAERLWLLTTSAQEFFEDLGWKVVDRQDAPEVVSRTRLFCELCLPEAALMLRVLG